MVESVQGQVVHMRKVSKKIMFVDIIVEEEKNSGIVEQHRQTLLLKFWERPELRDRCTRGVDKVQGCQIAVFFSLDIHIIYLLG